ncbi:unnamed protein product, partial [Effrenium voratum]
VAACAWMRGTPLCEPWVPMGRRGLLRSGPRAVCLTFCDKIHAKVQQQQRQDLRVVLPQFDRQRTWAWCPSTAAWWTRLRPKAGRGTRLSRTQSRSWADRRVREGIGKARSGDQKAALERYEAALELCPQHKDRAKLDRQGIEGLRCRASHRPGGFQRTWLSTVFLLKHTFEALKYREIARKRAREETAIAEEKRRRGSLR